MKKIIRLSGSGDSCAKVEFRHLVTTCDKVNELVDRVNYLTQKLEELEKKINGNTL